jgi:drug/metabolite transporter (DMT)-like permease
VQTNAAMDRRAWLLFASMCVIWGVPYLLIKVAVRDLSPPVLVLGRTGIAALLLLPIAGLRGEIRPALRHWRGVLLFGLVEMAIPWILLSSAETRLTSSLTGLLIAAVPLVGAVVVRLTGERESMGARRWSGLLIGIVGVGALVGLDLGSVSALPVAEVGAVAVCYAIGPIILFRSLADVPPLGVVAGSLLLAALAYAPLGIAEAPTSMPRASVVLSVIGLAVICTALAFIIFLALIAEVGPVRATVITYVNPAVAAILGVSILSEKITAGMGVGFILVLAGCFLATGRNRALAEA